MNGYNDDITNDQLAKLRQLFPEVFTEDNIDWARLKATLGEAVDLGERYGLSWKGKGDVFATIQEKTVQTLHPDQANSVDWDTTGNMFIEGDNLAALKILHKAYYGKVKMIYIDPPYNTGNDFIYNDDFKQTRRSYEAEVGITDDEGNVVRDDGLRTNTGGHKHSNWLNMMYPRLFLARNLLRQDGVIFVSIDDNEVHDLRLMMNEIFGEENFISQIIWKKKGTSTNVKGAQISSLTEYILVYGRSSKTELAQRWFSKDERVYNKLDSIGAYRTTVIEKKSSGSYDRNTMKFEILGRKPREGKRWQIGLTKAKELEERGRFVIENGIVKLKIYDFEDKDTFAANPNLLLDYGSTQSGQIEVNELLDGHHFDTPKPIALIKHLINLSVLRKDELADNIILDFFSGSGTTAHAVAELNAEDGGNRRWICVQLPELTDEKSEAYKAGYRTIADIARERIRRAGAKIRADFADKLAERETSLDLGFRSYSVGESNFKPWNEMVTNPAEIRQQMLDIIDPIESDATDESILTELLLKRGISPMAEVENRGAYLFVPSASLAIRLTPDLTEAEFGEILASGAQTVLLLSRALGTNETLRINLTLQAEQRGVRVEVV